jgi:hypothetical protein
MIPGGNNASFANAGAYSQGHARMNLAPASGQQALLDADVPNDFELSYPLLADYIFDRSVMAKYMTAYAIILQQVIVRRLSHTHGR